MTKKWEESSQVVTDRVKRNHICRYRNIPVLLSAEIAHPTQWPCNHKSAAPTTAATTIASVNMSH